jgi:DNA-directed RNA polymerase specialized sigma24 family protein
MARILGWAVKKTGSRVDGEELAQEVAVQYLSAMAEGPVAKPEHLLWKVAKYCWCHWLRGAVKRRSLTELDAVMYVADSGDFVSEMLADETKAAQLAKMRREISRLGSIRREAMILHYLDGLSVAGTAAKLNLSESAVTWYLFDARKKVRRELANMEAEYVYRPGRLAIGASGDEGPEPDTKYLRDSLIRQNLCLLCRDEGKSIEELTALTGIPRPYLEYDLDWLAAKEFMKLTGRKYATAFPIISKRHRQSVAAMYRDTRKDLIDKVIAYLWEYEPEIRAIGFYGARFPAGELMWAVITMFISYVSRNSPLLTRLKDRSHYPIRPDGGKYVVVAADQSEGQALAPGGYDGEILWGGFSGIWSDSCISGSGNDMFYWLGVNSFAGAEYRPEIVTAPHPRNALLHFIYTSVIKPGFSEAALEPHGREALAEAISDGLIKKEGGSFQPQFVIFTKEQLETLREKVYRPLAEAIEPVLNELGTRISAMHKATFPKINRLYVDYHTYLDLWDFGIYTLMYAALAGKIKMPDTPERDALLTLVLVK